MSKLNEIIQKAHQMPLLSSSSMRLLEIIADPDHSIQDVAKIVVTDSALTAKILELVNSAAFGLRQEISSVAHALPYVGEKSVVALAMNLASPQVFNRPLLGYESQKGELWAHGLRTAIAANELSGYAHEKILAGVAYTAGILHDIGKSVLSKFLTGLPAEMLKKLEKEEVRDYLEAEEAMVGANHCIIGAELAKHWKLPANLQAAIRHHHKPAEAEEAHRPLVYVIHLADMVAMMGGTGTGTDTLGYTLDQNYTKYIAITTSGMDNLMMTVMIEFDKTRTALFGAGKDGEP
ncbi:MAG: HDOD domain-containing protein [Thermodesulfobacteriota bacterium]